jgi:hypothetical protein
MSTMHGAATQVTGSRPAARRNRLMCLSILTWVSLLGLFMAPVWGAEANQGWSDATKSGIGCLVASGSALTASLWAGPNEVVMIAAGGSLVSSGTTPLLVALTATLVAATCSVGYAATPAVLWLVEQTEVLLGVGGDRAGAQTVSGGDTAYLRSRRAWSELDRASASR